MTQLKDVNVKRLKRGLMEVKKAINSKVGAVSKLKRAQVINKFKDLNYKYDQNTTSYKTESMIRKKKNIKL